MLSVKFESQLTKKDWTHIYFYFLIRKKKYWLFVLVWWFLIYLTLGPLNKIENSFFYSIIFVIIYLFIIISYRLLQYLKIISKKNRGLEKINWEINQDFMEGIGNTNLIKLYINKIFKVSETGKYFFIYKDKKENIQIPKAQIPEADLNAIRIFLKEKIVA